MKYVTWVLIFILVIALGALSWESLRSFLFSKETVEIVNTHNVVLEQIEKMGKLELVKYKFKDILEHSVKYKWVPSSTVALIISGEAVGCIDLQKVKKTDVVEKKDTVYVRLPDPELCYSKINHKESKVYDTKYTYFDDANLIDGAFKEAEKEIERIALQSNILEQTKENAEKILKPLLENISKKKIIFTYNPKNTNQKIEKK